MKGIGKLTAVQISLLVCSLMLFSFADATSEKQRVITYGCNDVVCQYSRLNKIDKMAIVDKINEFRNRVAGGEFPFFRHCVGNMKQVVWDEKLAQIAQYEANSCPAVDAYRNPKYSNNSAGENINSFIRAYTVEYYREKENFPKLNNTCDQITIAENSPINWTEPETWYNRAKSDILEYFNRGQMNDFWRIPIKGKNWKLLFRRADTGKIGCGYVLRMDKKNKDLQLKSYLTCIYCSYNMTLPHIAKPPCNGCFADNSTECEHCLRRKRHAPNEMNATAVVKAQQPSTTPNDESAEKPVLLNSSAANKTLSAAPLTIETVANKTLSAAPLTIETVQQSVIQNNNSAENRSIESSNNVIIEQHQPAVLSKVTEEKSLPTNLSDVTVDKAKPDMLSDNAKEKPIPMEHSNNVTGYQPALLSNVEKTITADKLLPAAADSEAIEEKAQITNLNNTSKSHSEEPSSLTITNLNNTTIEQYKPAVLNNTEKISPLERLNNFTTDKQHSVILNSVIEENPKLLNNITTDKLKSATINNVTDENEKIVAPLNNFTIEKPASTILNNITKEQPQLMTLNSISADKPKPLILSNITDENKLITVPLNNVGAGNVEPAILSNNTAEKSLLVPSNNFTAEKAQPKPLISNVAEEKSQLSTSIDVTTANPQPLLIVNATGEKPHLPLLNNTAAMKPQPLLIVNATGEKPHLPLLNNTAAMKPQPVTLNRKEKSQIVQLNNGTAIKPQSTITNRVGRSHRPSANNNVNAKKSPIVPVQDINIKKPQPAPLSNVIAAKSQAVHPKSINGKKIQQESSNNVSIPAGTSQAAPQKIMNENLPQPDPLRSITPEALAVNNINVNNLELDLSSSVIPKLPRAVPLSSVNENKPQAVPLSNIDAEKPPQPSALTQSVKYKNLCSDTADSFGYGDIPEDDNNIKYTCISRPNANAFNPPLKASRNHPHTFYGRNKRKEREVKKTVNNALKRMADNVLIITSENPLSTAVTNIFTAMSTYPSTYSGSSTFSSTFSNVFSSTFSSTFSSQFPAGAENCGGSTTNACTTAGATCSTTCPTTCSTTCTTTCPTTCSTTCTTTCPTTCSTTCPTTCSTTCPTTCPTTCSTTCPTTCPTSCSKMCSSETNPTTEMVVAFPSGSSSGSTSYVYSTMTATQYSAYTTGTFTPYLSTTNTASISSVSSNVPNKLQYQTDSNNCLTTCTTACPTTCTTTCPTITCTTTCPTTTCTTTCTTTTCTTTCPTTTTCTTTCPTTTTCTTTCPTTTTCTTTCPTTTCTTTCPTSTCSTTCATMYSTNGKLDSSCFSTESSVGSFNSGSIGTGTASSETMTTGTASFGSSASARTGTSSTPLIEDGTTDFCPFSTKSDKLALPNMHRLVKNAVDNEEKLSGNGSSMKTNSTNKLAKKKFSKIQKNNNTGSLMKTAKSLESAVPNMAEPNLIENTNSAQPSEFYDVDGDGNEPSLAVPDSADNKIPVILTLNGTQTYSAHNNSGLNYIENPFARRIIK